ncbi:MAG: cation diffusion facilitator family transporter [Pseudomonadota bacterium]
MAVSTAENARLLRIVSTASVVVALILIGVKGVAWFMTDSVALLASLIDSTMDSAASLINLFAIRYALAPADAEHRFGHGKAEALAGLGQSAFIAGSAVFLMLHAVDRIIHPMPVSDTDVGIAVMIFSIVLTALLVILQRLVIHQTDSTAIKADSLHYMGDLLVNVSIIVALLAATAGYSRVDAWFGIGIAFYILWNAWQISQDAFRHLLDREVSDEVRAEILRLIESRKGVTGVHDLRTRRSGQQMFVQMHIELDREMPLWQAHEIAEDVEQTIINRYPNCDVIVHEDPLPAVAPTTT